MCFDFGISEILLGTAAAAEASSVAGAAAFSGLPVLFSAPTAGLIGSGGALTAGGLANVVGLAGSLLSGVGSIAQGQSAKAAADYNAKVEKMQAVDAERRGSTLEGQQRTKYLQFIGRQRAAMGASGIVPDEGSFGDILAQTAVMGEQDAQQLRVNASREAWGHRAQATIDTYEGDQAATSGYFKGASSMINGTWNLMKSNPWWQSWLQKPATYGV